MKRTTRIVLTGLLGAAVAGSLAIAQNQSQDAPPEMQLPPGWTMDDVMACVEAGTPGEQHEHLAEHVGVWQGKTKMWMAPGTEPMESECVATVTEIMDGRYTKTEINGEFPGMGTFTGIGVYGFDNVSQQFQSTWIDNHSTGMMNGIGQLSDDGKTMTWVYSFNCPVTKQATVMREVEKMTGENSKTLEMYSTDPKSGEEYKMMEIAFTRTSDQAVSSAR